MRGTWLIQLLIGLILIVGASLTAEIFLPGSLYDEEVLVKEIQSQSNVYDGCETSRDKLLCSGIGISKDSDCTITKSCNYAGFIIENSTHFRIHAIEHDFSNKRPALIAFGFGIHKIEDNPAGGKERPFKCKSDLTLRDFRLFLLVNESQVREQPLRSTGDKATTTLDRKAWMKKCHNDVLLLNKRARHLENPKIEMQLLILGNDIISPLFVSHDATPDLHGNEYILPESRQLYSSTDGIFYSNVRQMVYY